MTWHARSLFGLFTALVARHAAVHRGRTALTIASVAIGVSVVVAVAVANESAIASFQGSADYVSGGAAIEVSSQGPGFADAAIARVRALSGVAAASGVVAGSATDPVTLAVYDLVGIDFVAAMGLSGDTRDSRWTERQKANVSGRIFERGAIVVSSSLARRLHAGLGSAVTMLVGSRSRTFFVAGIVDDEAMPIGARGAIFCDLSTAQEALDRIGRIDRIDVVPSSGADAGRLVRRLAAVLPRGTLISTPSRRTEVVAKMTDAFRFNLAALAAIALLVGAYLVFNAVSMSVVQRREEIGIARAVGATRSGIFAVFLLEGAAVGALGSGVGVLLGLVLARATSAVVARTIDALYAGTNPLGLAVPPATFVLAFAVGIGTALVASLLPALGAANVEPSTAMRAGSWEPARAAPFVPVTAAAVFFFGAAVVLARLPAVNERPLFGYAAAIAVIAGCSLLAPFFVAVAALAARVVLPPGAGAPLRLAPANLRARVRRNAVAVASLMIGVAMTVSVSTMIASFRQSVETWIGETLRGDLFVRPTAAVNADDVTMPSELAKRVRAVPGVAAVDVIRSKQIEVAGRPAFVGASDMRVTSTRGYLPLIDGGAWRSIGQGMVGAPVALASEPFARKFGVKRGDSIVVNTLQGPARLKIAGIYEDYSSDAGFIFLDIGTYRRLFGDDGISGFAVYAAPGVDAGVLRGRVERALSDARVLVQANSALRSSALAQFDRTFAVTSALEGIAVAVALMGVFATLAALVIERRREIGVLRCLGMARRQVREMVVAEASLLGVIGGLLGIAAGYAIAAILVYVINPQAFGWTIGFRPMIGFDVIVFASITITAALAGVLPAAAAARLDVAAALRAE